MMKQFSRWTQALTVVGVAFVATLPFWVIYATRLSHHEVVLIGSWTDGKPISIGGRRVMQVSTFFPDRSSEFVDVDVDSGAPTLAFTGRWKIVDERLVSENYSANMRAIDRLIYDVQSIRRNRHQPITSWPKVDCKGDDLTCTYDHAMNLKGEREFHFSRVKGDHFRGWRIASLRKKMAQRDVWLALLLIVVVACVGCRMFLRRRKDDLPPDVGSSPISL